MNTPRRVVIGHDEQGRSRVVLDSGPGLVSVNDIRGVETHEMWATDTSPAPIERVPTDVMGRPIQLTPRPLGSVIRVTDYQPDPFSHGTEVDPETVKAGFAFVAGEHVSSWKPGQHPGMHRTETIDYAVVLDGEMTLVLDDGEVELSPGDLVVQCGTNHAWVNRSDRVTRMLFVLLDGDFVPGLEEQFDPGAHGH